MQRNNSRDIEIGWLGDEVFVDNPGVGTLDVSQALHPVLFLDFPYIIG